MKIFVTGGAGFIGKYLVKLLIEQKHKVTIFDNFSNSSKEEILNKPYDQASVVKGDIRNYEDISKSLEGNDIVIHLAAKISVTESISNPIGTFETNVQGTENVLKACAKYKIKKFVALSSAAVYGNNDNPNHSFKESDDAKPISPYGQSKLKMEKKIEKISKENNLNTIVFRLFNVYGKGQTDEYAGVISKFTNCIRKNIPLRIYGDGNQTRDFVAIKDVVNFISKQITLKLENTFDVFNIGYGQSTKIIELANLMVKISGKKNKMIFEDQKEGDIFHSKASIEKAKRHLGYNPEIPLNEGIAKFLEL